MLVAAAASEPVMAYRADATVHAVKHAAMPSAPRMNMWRRGYRGAMRESGTELRRAQQLWLRIICWMVRLEVTPMMRRTLAK